MMNDITTIMDSKYHTRVYNAISEDSNKMVHVLSTLLMCEMFTMRSVNSNNTCRCYGVGVFICVLIKVLQWCLCFL